MEVIRAVKETVVFFDGLTVDGYRMPNGDFRVGLSGASRVLGYADNWLPRLLSQRGKPFESLCGMGFTDNIQKTVSETDRGDRLAQTISLEDFNRCIAYATSKGKRAALALQLSLTQMALNDFFREAFDQVPLTIDEKRVLFYKAYASTISPEDWRRMDREDIVKLALYGDEVHVRWGLWNQ